MIKLSLAEKLNILFGVIMVIIYFTVGFLLTFINSVFTNIDETYKRLFGIIIIIYAFYRMYRVYSYYGRIKENNSVANDDKKI
jgi:hypothetical protein